MENTTLYKELNNIPLADDDPQGKHLVDSSISYFKSSRFFFQLSFLTMGTMQALNVILV